VRPIVLIPFGVLILGAGLAAGLVAGSSADDDSIGVEAEVVVRDDDGGVRTLTTAAASARIESLESLLRRSRDRRAGRFDDDDSEDGAAAIEIDAEALQPTPPLRHPDGRRYTPDEIRALARGSKDPEVRRAAILALRRIDTDDARTTLQAILADKETSADMRLLTAKVLANRPHRDHLPSELITALADETDPELRKVLARGVAGLRERGVWMREISAALGVETDPEVRRALLSAVARSSRDPAARAELLAIAISPLAPANERRTALGALTRRAPDKEMVAQLRPLLTDPDPAVRAQALNVLSRDRGMPLGTLRAGLADGDASVRATALWRGMNHFRRYSKDKRVPKGQLAAAAARVMKLATSDPDAGVRRAGISASRHLPKKQRATVLASGRNDSDLGVRLAAYAASGRKIALGATDQFLGALSAPDARTRDYAYSQLRRLHGVRVPFQGIWNTDARNTAITEIRAAIR